MADYTEKRRQAQERITQLETDQKAFTDPTKKARATAKLASTRELLGRIEQKIAGATNGSPPKAAKRAKRAAKK